MARAFDRRALALGAVLVTAVFVAETPAQSPAERQPHPGQLMRFEESGAAHGFLPYSPEFGMCTGAAAADFDDDGDIDVFVPNGDGVPDQLYRNHEGRFFEVAMVVGLASLESHRTALWVDYDGDRDLDLFLTTDRAGAPTSFRLMRQRADQTFEDVTVEAGLFLQAEVLPNHIVHRGGVCAGDIDGDGWVDIYAGLWGGKPNLFRNRGNGTFQDITTLSGVAPFEGETQWQPMMFDVNRDGRLDLYVAVDFGPNHLWINDGDWTFTDHAVSAGCDILMHDMGMALVDYDGDGDLDLYTSNIYGYEGEVEYNVLLRNDSAPGVLRFVDVSEESGVANAGWGWGVTGFDADRDGLLDMAGTNGFFYDVWGADRTRLWKQVPGPQPRFVEVGAHSGVDDNYWGGSLLALDFDRDGDQDLFQTCMDGVLLLYENHGPAAPQTMGRPSQYLVVQPRMDGPNHRAIGATVTVRAGGRRQTRLISAGASCLGQEPAEAFFGLGEYALVDEVAVRFPDGRKKVLHHIEAGQVLVVEP